MTGTGGRGRVSLGLDLGSTGLRAAYAPADPPGAGHDRVRVLEDSDAGVPWLLCERTAAGRLPVTFPSLKSALGSGRPVRDGGAEAAPEELMARALRTLRTRVEAAASAEVVRTVLSVPAGYGSAQRAALRSAAQRAGLAGPRLINDSAAAVIGHTAGGGSGTYLVLGTGYRGFELGLVRAVRRHYRALGYEGAEAPGARAFGEWVLAVVFPLLREHALLPGGAEPARADWHRMLRGACRLWERLDARAAPSGPVVELDLGFPRFHFGLPRAALDDYRQQQAARIRDRARTLFQQTGVEHSHVDAVLLAGRTTGIGRCALAPLGLPFVELDEAHLARGAQLYAQQLERTQQSPEEEGALLPPDPSGDTLGGEPRLTATLLPAPGPDPAADPSPATPAQPDPAAAPPSPPSAAAPPAPPSPSSPAHGREFLDEARRLAATGRTDEACALLREVLDETREVLDELLRRQDGTVSVPEQDTAPVPEPEQQTPVPEQEPGAAPPGPRPGPTGEAARRLAHARLLLGQRRWGQAVHASHAAWAGETARSAGAADVLEAMIDVHCEAAMAASGPEHFEQADSWLRCAYQHDSTNARVRGLLAERTYRHAAELHRRGTRREALEALRACLGWDPEHPRAQELLTLLQGPGIRPRGGV